MAKLTINKAKMIIDYVITKDSIKQHAANVAVCMGAMAKYFKEDVEHWQAIGYLHDFDYEMYPEEHLDHTEEPLRAMDISESDIRAILAHGYEVTSEVIPISKLEKSLYTVDGLSGIIQAAARMRPNGILDMDLKSFMKKWKDRKFAEKCNRDVILKGCGMLGMEIEEIASICIEAMKENAEELALTGQEKN